MPSPAYGLGACVFQPAGLQTTSRCSSSKITHGTMRHENIFPHPNESVESRCGGHPSKAGTIEPLWSCAAVPRRDGVGIGVVLLGRTSLAAVRAHHRHKIFNEFGLLPRTDSTLSHTVLNNTFFAC